jgi:hypothetical protein
MDWLRSGNPPSHSPWEGFGQAGSTPEIRERHRQPKGAKLMHLTHPGESKATGRRVDPRYAPLLVPAIMAIAISLVVSLVQAIVRLGFTPSLVPAWLTSFAIGVIVAVPTAILVAPRAQRLVSHLTGPPPRPTQDDGCFDR